MKTSRVSRVVWILTAMQSGRCYTVDDLAEYLGRAWVMIPEGRNYNIKLRFLPKVAQNVAEVQWHAPRKLLATTMGPPPLNSRLTDLAK